MVQGKGEPPVTEEVDLSKELTRQQYEALVDKALDTHEQDAEIYLKKVQARMERSELTSHRLLAPKLWDKFLSLSQAIYFNGS